jgi:hypothetical protein
MRAFITFLVLFFCLPQAFATSDNIPQNINMKNWIFPREVKNYPMTAMGTVQDSENKLLGGLIAFKGTDEKTKKTKSILVAFYMDKNAAPHFSTFDELEGPVNAIACTNKDLSKSFEGVTSLCWVGGNFQFVDTGYSETAQFGGLVQAYNILSADKNDWAMSRVNGFYDGTVETLNYQEGRLVVTGKNLSTDCPNCKAGEPQQSFPTQTTTSTYWTAYK